MRKLSTLTAGGLLVLGAFLGGCGGSDCADECTLGSHSCQGDTLRTCGDYDGDICTEWGNDFTCPDQCLVDRCVSSCQDECPGGTRRCQGTDFQVCGDIDGDDCTEWGQAQPCPAGQTCHDGQCVTTCADPCPGEGQRECVSGQVGQYRVCACDAGCCQWGAAQDCPAGQSCSNGQCVACTDDCSPAGARECTDGDSFRVCGNVDDDPCNEWAAPADCTPPEVCVNGACTPACQDDCPGTGARSCTLDARGYQTCGNFDADACLELGPATPCAPSERCDQGVCVFSCTDECLAGEKRCAGPGYQLCGQFDADPCAEWGAISDCKQNETCSNGVCSAVCQDECEPGARECSGFQSLRECGEFDHDPCRDWGPPETCNLWERCLDVAGPAACVIICFNDCEPMDARQCVGDGYQVCGDHDWDACLEWSDPVACQAGELCSGGTCTTAPCTDDCTPAGLTECVMSHSVRTCGQHDNDACLDWSAATACGAGRTCQAGACVESCSDTCAPGSIGCLDGDTRWSCTDANGDGCLEQAPTDCAAGQSCSAGVCGTGCVDDALEENDSALLATEAGEGSRDGTICPDDVDWFWVIVPADQGLRVVLAFDGFAADLDLELYEDPELQVPVAVSAGISSSETVVARATQADRLFYARVSGYDGATGAYQLQVQLLSAGECFDDHLEENDSMQAAMFILNGSYPELVMCPGDEDWYEHYMFSGETLSTQIAFLHAQGDLDLRLLDAQGVELDASNSSGDGEEVSVTIAEEGLYYVRVIDYAVTQETAYAMTVSYGGDCVDDLLEPNDSAAEAFPLTAGTEPGLQLCSNDEDWFTVYVLAGGSLLASIDFSHAAGDLDLALLDPAGAVLDYSYSTSDNELVGADGLSAGWYYLRVTGYQGAENSYSLEIVD